MHFKPQAFSSTSTFHNSLRTSYLLEIHMYPVNQFLGPTIYVGQLLLSHFSPTIYVKLFALSAPACC